MNQAARPAHFGYTHAGLSSTKALLRVNIIRDLSKYLFSNRARIAAGAWTHDLPVAVVSE